MDDDEPVVTRTVSAPIYVTKADPLAPAFGGAALAAAGVLMFAIYVLLSNMAGTWTDATKYFDKDKWYIVIVGGGGAVAICFVLGLLIGKVTSGSRA